MLRPSVRLRLTVLYGGLFLLAGAMLIGITQYLLRERLYDAIPTPRERVAEAFDLPEPRFQPNPAFGPRASDGRTVTEFLEDEYRDIEEGIVRAQLIQSSFALLFSGGGAFVLGWIVAGRALRPVHRITEAARRASEANLHERVGISGPNDELKDLGDTFDGMLSRLEAAFAAQKTFAANASHELRTPISVLRTEAEVRLNEDGLSDSERTFAESVLAASEESAQIIDGLLALARSESSMIARQTVDLAEVVGDVAGELAEAADRAAIDFNLDLLPAFVLGDRELVGRLAYNLIDNGIRHNVPDGWVAVRVSGDKADPCIEVANTGPVVPQANVASLYEPFMQADTTRGGHGLGLAIVRAIVDAHGGEISTTARSEGGLLIRIKLPAPADVQSVEQGFPRS